MVISALSSFFRSTLIRRRSNFISFVKDYTGCWLDNRKDIGSTVTQKYKSLFSSQGVCYLTDLDGLILPKVNESLFPKLVAIPFDNEIKDV